MSRYELYCTGNYHLSTYVSKIKENDIDCIIEEKDGNFYIDIMYVSDLYKLSKLIDAELIITHNVAGEPAIEIYDDWRE